MNVVLICLAVHCALTIGHVIQDAQEILSNSTDSVASSNASDCMDPKKPMARRSTRIILRTGNGNPRKYKIVIKKKRHRVRPPIKVTAKTITTSHISETQPAQYPYSSNEMSNDVPAIEKWLNDPNPDKVPQIISDSEIKEASFFQKLVVDLCNSLHNMSDFWTVVTKKFQLDLPEMRLLYGYLKFVVDMSQKLGADHLPLVKLLEEVIKHTPISVHDTLLSSKESDEEDNNIGLNTNNIGGNTLPNGTEYAYTKENNPQISISEYVYKDSNEEENQLLDGAELDSSQEMNKQSMEDLIDSSEASSETYLAYEIPNDYDIPPKVQDKDVKPEASYPPKSGLRERVTKNEVLPNIIENNSTTSEASSKEVIGINQYKPIDPTNNEPALQVLPKNKNSTKNLQQDLSPSSTKDKEKNDSDENLTIFQVESVLESLKKKANGLNIPIIEPIPRSPKPIKQKAGNNETSAAISDNYTDEIISSINVQIVDDLLKKLNKSVPLAIQKPVNLPLILSKTDLLKLQAIPKSENVTEKSDNETAGLENIEPGYHLDKENFTLSKVSVFNEQKPVNIKSHALETAVHMNTSEIEEHRLELDGNRPFSQNITKTELVNLKNDPVAPLPEALTQNQSKHNYNDNNIPLSQDSFTSIIEHDSNKPEKYKNSKPQPKTIKEDVKIELSTSEQVPKKSENSMAEPDELKSELSVAISPKHYNKNKNDYKNNKLILLQKLSNDSIDADNVPESEKMQTSTINVKTKNNTDPLVGILTLHKNAFTNHDKNNNASKIPNFQITTEKVLIFDKNTNLLQNLDDEDNTSPDLVFLESGNLPDQFYESQNTLPALLPAGAIENEHNLSLILPTEYNKSKIDSEKHLKVFQYDGDNNYDNVDYPDLEEFYDDSTLIKPSKNSFLQVKPYLKTVSEKTPDKTYQSQKMLDEPLFLEPFLNQPNEFKSRGIEMPVVSERDAGEYGDTIFFDKLPTLFKKPDDDVFKKNKNVFLAIIPTGVVSQEIYTPQPSIETLSIESLKKDPDVHISELLEDKNHNQGYEVMQADELPIIKNITDEVHKLQQSNDTEIKVIKETFLVKPKDNIESPILSIEMIPKDLAKIYQGIFKTFKTKYPKHINEYDDISALFKNTTRYEDLLNQTLPKVPDSKIVRGKKVARITDSIDSVRNGISDSSNDKVVEKINPKHDVHNTKEYYTKYGYPSDGNSYSIKSKYAALNRYPKIKKMVRFLLRNYFSNPLYVRVLPNGQKEYILQTKKIYKDNQLLPSEISPNQLEHTNFEPNLEDFKVKYWKIPPNNLNHAVFGEADLYDEGKVPNLDQDSKYIIKLLKKLALVDEKKFKGTFHLPLKIIKYLKILEDRNGNLKSPMESNDVHVILNWLEKVIREKPAKKVKKPWRHPKRIISTTKFYPKPLDEDFNLYFIKKLIDQIIVFYSKLLRKKCDKN